MHHCTIPRPPSTLTSIPWPPPPPPDRPQVGLGTGWHQLLVRKYQYTEGFPYLIVKLALPPVPASPLSGETQALWYAYSHPVPDVTCGVQFDSWNSDPEGSLLVGPAPYTFPNALSWQDLFNGTTNLAAVNRSRRLQYSAALTCTGDCCPQMAPRLRTVPLPRWTHCDNPGTAGAAGAHVNWGPLGKPFWMDGPPKVNCRPREAATAFLTLMDLEFRVHDGTGVCLKMNLELMSMFDSRADCARRATRTGPAIFADLSTNDFLPEAEQFCTGWCGSFVLLQVYIHQIWYCRGAPSHPYALWIPQGPVPDGNPELCLALTGFGKYQSMPCETKLPYVCNLWPPWKDPTAPPPPPTPTPTPSLSTQKGAAMPEVVEEVTTAWVLYVVLTLSIAFLSSFVSLFFWRCWRRAGKLQHGSPITHNVEPAMPASDVQLTDGTQTLGSSSGSEPGSSAITALQLWATTDATSPIKPMEVLGTGSFGTVYKGLTTAGGFVALKLLHDHVAMASFEREAALLRQLRHPNIVYFGGVLQMDTRTYMVMELCTEGSLQSLLNRTGAFTARAVSFYSKDILHGLEYLHHKGYIHRDLKPHNILVTNQGACKIADFGLCGLFMNVVLPAGAKSHVPAGAADSMSHGFPQSHSEAHTTLGSAEESCQSIIGTPLYMAPEAMRRIISQTNDIFSFGLTMLQCITNKHPWAHLGVRGWQLMYMMAPDVISAHPVPAWLPLNAKVFFESCLELDHSKRPSCKELLQDIFITDPSQLSLEPSSEPSSPLADESDSPSRNSTHSSQGPANYQDGLVVMVHNGQHYQSGQGTLLVDGS